ncbi:MAG: SPOR domain-containing protein, partial [Halieaceae bacterium]|nr:SPOR domain-containing protein [Halieaceae bacterium]
LTRPAAPTAELPAAQTPLARTSTAGMPATRTPAAAAPPRETEVAAEPVRTPEPAGEQAVRLEDAFIVQIGAYRLRAEAQAAADRLANGKLSIVPTERNGETWFVLLLGAYPSIEAARAAGAEYEANTGGSYWVRTGDDLRKVLAAPVTPG